ARLERPAVQVAVAPLLQLVGVALLAGLALGLDDDPAERVGEALLLEQVEERGLSAEPVAKSLAELLDRSVLGGTDAGAERGRARLVAAQLVPRLLAEPRAQVPDEQRPDLLLRHRLLVDALVARHAHVDARAGREVVVLVDVVEDHLLDLDRRR